jgi:hypothetical protein
MTIAYQLNRTGEGHPHHNSIPFHPSFNCGLPINIYSAIRVSDIGDLLRSGSFLLAISTGPTGRRNPYLLIKKVNAPGYIIEAQGPIPHPFTSGGVLYFVRINYILEKACEERMQADFIINNKFVRRLQWYPLGDSLRKDRKLLRS